MFTLKTTNQYRKDRNRCKKRGYDISLLNDVIEHYLRNKYYRENRMERSARFYASGILYTGDE